MKETRQIYTKERRMDEKEVQIEVNARKKEGRKTSNTKRTKKIHTPIP